MKNKEFHKLLKKSNSKSNAGFTLTELLVGLIMSTIVIAGAGWGVLQILRTTKTETSRVTTRNETSRAFNFISDEVKAAQSMEANESSTSYISTGDLATVATNFSLPTGGEVALALQVPGVDQRIIYYVAPSTNTWKKPLTIYRWGPNLGTDGSYTDADVPNNWQYEALIDGVSDVNQTALCDVNGDDEAEPVTYQGFFACVVDNDGDGILENDLTADTNGDSVIDSGDGADTDGVSITAQLYFAGENEKGVYKTDSQVVARSRVAPLRKPELTETKLLEITPLQSNYGRNIVEGDPDTACWIVRNDFGQGDDPNARPGSGNELTNTSTWIHEDNRQPQPLNIDTSQPFTISASAFGGSNDKCLARGNKHKRIWDSGSGEYRYVDSTGNAIDPSTDDGSTRIAADGTEEIHTYEHKIWHTIDFSDPDTYNGDNNTSPDVDRSATSNPPTEGEAGAGEVRIFKNGDTISDYLGYDADNTGDRDQDSIEQFLFDRDLVDSNGQVTIDDNQRIIAFEIGQDVEGTGGNPNPGFDLQDTIFLMTSDAFNN